MAAQTHNALGPSKRRISSSLPELKSFKRPSGSETQKNPAHHKEIEHIVIDSEDPVYDDIIYRETDMPPDQQSTDSQDNKIDMAQRATYVNVPTTTTQRAMYRYIAYNARRESEREDVANKKKPRSYNGYGLCSVVVILMVVGSLAVAGAVMGGYAVYTVHSENADLKERLLQLTEGISTLEVSHQLTEFKHQITNLTAKLDILEQQQISTAEEQKTVPTQLKDCKLFQNASRPMFVELSTESNETRIQIEQLQQELIETMTRTCELSHQLNYTQQLVKELNSTTHLLTKQLNVTQRDVGQLKSQVLLDRKELDKVNSALTNRTNEIQNQLTKEFAEIRRDLNTTKEILAADIADVNSTQEELNQAIQENFKNLSSGLDALSLQSTLQLRIIHTNLSERITANEANISALSENLSNTETELTSELHELSAQTQKNFTQLRNSLTSAINRTETNIRTDLDAFANATDVKIATLEQAVTKTNDLLLNQTDELREEFNNELVEIRGELNKTEKQLSSDIASVNSTLLEFSLVVQESLSNVSIGLDTQTIQNTLQLQSIHTNLSERITQTETNIRTDLDDFANATDLMIATLEQAVATANEVLLNQTDELLQLQTVQANLSEQVTLNKVNTETLSENQTKFNLKLTAELQLLLIRIRDNISELEHSLMVASNASEHSLNTTRHELLHEVYLTRVSVDTLKESTADQLANLSTTIAEVDRNLSSQIKDNSDTKQDVLRIKEKIQEVEGLTQILESGQNRTTEDLYSLHQRVEDYHSGVAVTVGSNRLTCLFAITTILAIYFYD